MTIVKVKFKKLYTCNICNEEFEWGEGCEWFGTLEVVENVVCSQECKEKSGLKDV